MADKGSDRPERVHPRVSGWSELSLLWRLFAANAAVFIAAFALLAWTPVTVHRIATPSELLVLSIGLVVLLAVDLTLLRRELQPLRRLAAMMAAFDPGHLERRVGSFDHAGREVTVLAAALNAMLDRIERERRNSGRRILAAQEDERMRIARE